MSDNDELAWSLEADDVRRARYNCDAFEKLKVGRKDLFDGLAAIERLIPLIERAMKSGATSDIRECSTARTSATGYADREKAANFQMDDLLSVLNFIDQNSLKQVEEENKNESLRIEAVKSRIAEEERRAAAEKAEAERMAELLRKHGHL